VSTHPSSSPPPGRATIGWIDERVGAGRGVRRLLRYIFPEHWSFLIGEIALYAFIMLLASGTYLALFFEPTASETLYTGSYEPLQGQTMSIAYNSALRLSLDNPFGLLMRQTHHWAALVFVAAIVSHLLRIFFTGAFRKPRDINWFIGLTILLLSLIEGFAGYSMPDDLLSGMGIAIAYSVVVSIPILGANLAVLLWGGEFPGANEFISRLFIVHVFILPALLAILIVVHLAIIMRQHHSQFREPGHTETNVVGAPTWPAYALRSTGLFMAVSAVLILLGGLIQINPIWQWGPFDPAIGTNAAQPDWYLGWLIGALRVMPPIELHFWGHTWVPNPFWGGVLFPGLVFGVLYAIPSLDRRFRRDQLPHNLLDRPRDSPRRTAHGAAFFSFITLIFVTGAADRLLVTLGMSYTVQIWIARGALIFVPPVVYVVTLHICRELRRLPPRPDPRASPPVPVGAGPSGPPGSGTAGPAAPAAPQGPAAPQSRA
jgi:ubiquinol-cytochrome c reductase cytochrome b subunit